MVAAATRSHPHATISGLALGPTSLCAVLRRDAAATPSVWRRALAPPPADGNGDWPALTEAFAALLQECGSTQATASLALLPPLAEVRAVLLPPLGDADTRALLTRNASKYFVGARGPQVVACATRSARAKDSEPRLVAAASSRLVQMVHECAQAAGITLRTLVPAEAAWAAAADRLSSRRSAAAAGSAAAGNAATGGAASGTAVLVLDAQHAHLLHTNGAVLTGLRRFRPVAQDAPRVSEAARGAALAVAGSDSAFLVGLTSAAAAPRPLVGAGTATAALAASADALAAEGASIADSLQLETDSTRTARSAGAQRLAVRLAAAAAACLALAGALQLWDVQRELAAVRAEREALRPQLGTTLVGRTTVETAFRQLAALSVQQREAPAWSTVLSDLSRQLPPESYLTGFRGRADTVGIDGLALSAARVFDAVERVPRLQEVRASSPVRRETTAEGEALERFQLSALLRDPPPPRTTTLGGGDPRDRAAHALDTRSPCALDWRVGAHPGASVRVRREAVHGGARRCTRRAQRRTAGPLAGARGGGSGPNAIPACSRWPTRSSAKCRHACSLVAMM